MKSRARLAALLALPLLLACASAAAQEPSPDGSSPPGGSAPSDGSMAANGTIPASDVPPASPAQDASASSACTQPGKNIQCTGFGSIATDTQRDIKGEAITVDITLWLNTNYQDQGARWLLFSVRNVTGDSPEPIAISLLKFATANGEIVTTRVDHDKPNEIDLWVDVLDTPVNTPITLSVQVGAGDRGAYRLEALVLAFDRGYEVLKPGGSEAVLYASTLLGVNKESGALGNAGGASLLQGKKTPNLVLPGFVASLGIALWLRRRTA
jgi:hypothetical protein